MVAVATDGPIHARLNPLVPSGHRTMISITAAQIEAALAGIVFDTLVTSIEFVRSNIGHLKDSLWSVDLFRCESLLLRSHWVMVVMDVFTRRIIGFGIERADPCGASICRMFNQIIVGKSLPQHLSSDRDPLFRFHRTRCAY